MSLFGPVHSVKRTIQTKHRIFLVGLLVVMAGVFVYIHRLRPTVTVPIVTQVVLQAIVPSVKTLYPAPGVTVLSSSSHHVSSTLPVLQGALISPDTFGAESIMVKDRATGLVLYRKNEYQKRPLASLTKLMSALVLLEAEPQWASSTAVVSDMLADSHLASGDKHTLEELWQIGLIVSSNKAIMTLVDAVSISREEFVARMNQKALELGMTDTTFVEPTGLDSGNVASASDIALLLDEAMKQERIRETVLKREYVVPATSGKKAQRLWNTDWLLLGWIPNTIYHIVGGKTGYIPEAGYNFSVQVSNKEGQVITAVVLGAKTHEARFTEARDVIDWVFAHYVWPMKE